MDRTLRFRRSLATRLLQIAGAAALAAPAVHAAGCGGVVIVDAGSGGAGGADPTSTTGDTGSSSSSAGASTSTDVSSSSVSTGTGTPTGDIECFGWSADEPCPGAAVVLTYLQQNDCEDGQYTAAVLSGPYEQPGQCCYEVQLESCAVPGRPFLAAGAPLTAAARPGRGNAAVVSAGPRSGALTTTQRGALAAAWTRDALLEHASIASFARFSLELLAAGAPSDLVEAAHRAALDEIRHARLCFALAGAYGGAPVEPGPFPLGAAVPVSANLAELAASAVREGCVGEAIAAVLAAEQLARATDPAVREALAAIADDEARHAELAFRAVAWALAAGGDEVRAAVAAALEDAARRPPEAGDPGDDPSGALAAHGRLDAAAGRAAAARALCEVVLPCARALLGDERAPRASEAPAAIRA